MAQNKFPGVWRVTDQNFHEFTHSGRPSVNFVIDPSKAGADFFDKVHAGFANQGVNVAMMRLRRCFQVVISLL